MRRYINIVENASNPLSEVENFAKTVGVDLSMRKEDGFLVIDWIENKGEKGAAREVLDRLKAVVAEHDVPLRLEVWDANQKLIEYYESLDFMLDGEPEEGQPVYMVWAAS